MDAILPGALEDPENEVEVSRRIEESRMVKGSPEAWVTMTELASERQGFLPWYSS